MGTWSLPEFAVWSDWTMCLLLEIVLLLKWVEVLMLMNGWDFQKWFAKTTITFSCLLLYYTLRGFLSLIHDGYVLDKVLTYPMMNTVQQVSLRHSGTATMTYPFSPGSCDSLSIQPFQLVSHLRARVRHLLDIKFWLVWVLPAGPYQSFQPTPTACVCMGSTVCSHQSTTWPQGVRVLVWVLFTAYYL